MFSQDAYQRTSSRNLQARLRLREWTARHVRLQELDRPLRSNRKRLKFRGNYGGVSFGERHRLHAGSFEYPTAFHRDENLDGSFDALIGGRKTLRFFQVKPIHDEVWRTNHWVAQVFRPINCQRRWAHDLAGSDFFFHGCEAIFEMQFARAPVVVKPVCAVGLLLSFDENGARAEGMNGTSGNVDHLAGVDVDPAQQLLGAILLDGLGELFARNAGLQSHRHL